MLYSSVADIYDHIGETRRRLVERVGSLSEEQQTARTAEGTWTVAEIVEHLSLTERRLYGMMEMILGAAEKSAAATPAAEGTTPTAAAPTPAGGAASGFRPFSVEEWAERARGQKFEAPEFIRPAGGVSVAGSLARLTESRAQFEALRPRLERAGDLSTATYPHPAFGPLNPYQWLAFVGLHEARHLAQIERLLKAADAN